MSNETIQTAKEIVEYAINKNISVQAACEKKGRGKNYVSNLLSNPKFKGRSVDREDFDDFFETYQEYNNKKNNTKNITRNPIVARRVEARNVAPENQDIHEFVLANMSMSSQDIANQLNMPNGKWTIAGIKSNITKNGGQIIPKVKNIRTKNAIENNVPDLTAEELEDLNYNADTDKRYDERSKGEIIRGKDEFKGEHGRNIKRITGYKYRIMIRGEADLAGSFSREEMDSVYRLYSNMDGAGLTLRALSREFPTLSFRDFKRILRAFNITKSSLAVAPHVKEELSEDEITSLIMRNKENSILKKLDNGRTKYMEKRNLELQQELYEFRNDATWINQVIDRYFEDKRVPLIKHTATKTNKALKKNTSKNSAKPLMSVFGDIHYGKKFENTIFGRGFNKDIAHERIMKIAELTAKAANENNSPEIVMICMGDLLESAMPEGMHPGHCLEMDLFQDEQIIYAFDSLAKMLSHIIENTNVPITYCSINGNHDRIGAKRDEDKNRTAGKLVSAFLKRIFINEKRVTFQLPEDNLLTLVKGNICVFAHHGDSSLMKRKPVELINLFGRGPNYFNVILSGHWHKTKIEDGTNYTGLTIPSVTSADGYTQNELGYNTLPGFVMASEAECGYGFDYKKITLY